MSKKIPAKPFSSTSDGKLQNPTKAQRQEPNAKSVAGRPGANTTPPTSPSQSVPQKNRSGWLLLFLVVVALGSAYLGFELGNDYFAPSNRVEIAQTELTYEVGDVGRLRANVSGEFDRYDLFWTSSNLDVVYIDNGGNLAALNPGQVIVTASVGNGSVKDTIVITVTDPEIVSE